MPRRKGLLFSARAPASSSFIPLVIPIVSSGAASAGLASIA